MFRHDITQPSNRNPNCDTRTLNKVMGMKANLNKDTCIYIALFPKTSQINHNHKVGRF